MSRAGRERNMKQKIQLTQTISHSDFEFVAKLLLLQARTLWNVTACIGNATPFARRIAERMGKPEIGDWVYEQSSSYLLPPQWKAYPALHKIGKLLEITEEPVPNWDPEDEEGPPLEKVIYIEMLDGRTFRWANARVAAFYWEGMEGMSSWGTQEMKK